MSILRVVIINSAQRHRIIPESPAIERGFFVSCSLIGEESRMPNMPDKPDTWAVALAWLSQHAPILYAAGLSCVMAVLRITYGGGTGRQMLIEGAICGGKLLTGLQTSSCHGDLTDGLRWMRRPARMDQQDDEAGL